MSEKNNPLGDLLLSELKDLNKRVNQIDITLERNTVILDEHTKRSDSLEKHVLILEEEVQKVDKKFSKLEGAMALLGVISIIAGIIAAVVQFL